MPAVRLREPGRHAVLRPVRGGAGASLPALKRGPTFSPFPSRRRDGLAKHSRSEGAGGSTADWLDTQASIRVHRTLSRDGWPDFVFAFHDGEEIGPRMLARIAKRTGLTPSDLWSYDQLTGRLSGP